MALCWGGPADVTTSKSLAGITSSSSRFSRPSPPAVTRHTSTFGRHISPALSLSLSLSVARPHARLTHRRRRLPVALRGTSAPRSVDADCLGCGRGLRPEALIDLPQTYVRRPDSSVDDLRRRWDKLRSTDWRREGRRGRGARGEGKILIISVTKIHTAQLCGRINEFSMHVGKMSGWRREGNSGQCAVWLREMVLAPVWKWFGTDVQALIYHLMSSNNAKLSREMFCADKNGQW